MTAAFPLIGHQDAEARFLAARASNRLHHGWIFQGPSGIGKSTFAKRIAALMLGAETTDAPTDDRVMQLILSGGHPDMKWVKRELNEKDKLRQDITVDQIRDLNHFFSLRPAMSGWRVGVIDSLDEMNVSGMNALLKTLEEPPRNALLILVSHGQKPMLPTIRSRCQVLRLYPLSDEDTRTVLEGFDGDVSLAAKLANGRPGYGVELSQSGGAKAVQAARALLKTPIKPSPGVASSAISAAVSDPGALSAFADTLMQWTALEADDKPALGKTWLALHEVRSTADALNLTPLQTAGKLFATLQQGLKAVSA
jgi:DNA polymerase-3 subunit delta'